MEYTTACQVLPNTVSSSDWQNSIRHRFGTPLRIATIHGLVRKPELNGKQCIVEDRVSGRWIVKLQDQPLQSFRIKATNLKVPQSRQQQQPQVI